jgi:hypothetical protein
MKRSFATILLVLTAALTACGSPPTDTGNSNSDQDQTATPEEAAYQGCVFAARCDAGDGHHNFMSECETMMMKWLGGMSDSQRGLCAAEIVELLATNPPCSNAGQSPPSCPGTPNSGK